MPARPAKIGLSVLIIAYLAVVVVGPLASPVGSKDLTIPAARAVQPLHAALHLGHGYRFFAPAPGPSQILSFTGFTAEGDSVSGQFPDRSVHSPRLLYHRWFMLSETMAREFRAVVNDQDQERKWQAYAVKIQQYDDAGHFSLAKQLKQEKAEEETLYQKQSQRAKQLAQSIAGALRELHDLEEVSIYTQTRLLPFPEELRAGISLTDSQYLTKKKLIGRLDAAGIFTFIPPESEGGGK